MNYKTRISALTEMLLEHLKGYVELKCRLKFEVEDRMKLAQDAVNLLFETRSEAGPLTQEVLDTFDRSVRLWSNRYAVQES